MLRQDYLKLVEFENQLYEYLNLQINNGFDNFLLDSNSTGFFDLDTENKTLDIQITAKVGNDVNNLDALEQNSTKKLSTLSGGELTKTMMAFLLSIIRTAPTPFFIMDEVNSVDAYCYYPALVAMVSLNFYRSFVVFVKPDVFLDESNRSIICQQLTKVVDTHDNIAYKQAVVVFPLAANEHWTGHHGQCDCVNSRCIYDTYNRVQFYKRRTANEDNVGIHSSNSRSSSNSSSR